NQSGPACWHPGRKFAASMECAIDTGLTPMSSPIIDVQSLTKSYGQVHALQGVSFSVQEGEVFGLLGPNGAGKTSTVEILEGLRPSDGGTVSVCGLDPQTSGNALKQEIGAVLQAT